MENIIKGMKVVFKSFGPQFESNEQGLGAGGGGEALCGPPTWKFSEVVEVGLNLNISRRIT